MKYIFNENPQGRIFRIVFLIYGIASIAASMIAFLVGNIDMSSTVAAVAVSFGCLAFFADRIQAGVPYNDAMREEISKRNLIAATLYVRRKNRFLVPLSVQGVLLTLTIMSPAIIYAVVKVYLPTSILPLFIIVSLMVAVVMIVLNIYLIVRSAQ